MNSELTKEKELEKYTRSQYKGRFGILYSTKSTKGLQTNLNFKNRLSNITNKKSKKDVIGSLLESHNYLKRNKSFNPIINEVNDLELEKLYNINKKEEGILPIINFLKIDKCSILKYGVKKSLEEIKYSYCKTCDHNLLNPICLACIKTCHKGHLIKYIIAKGKIKCSCGEKNHYQRDLLNSSFINRTENIICLCNEWNEISKIGFYYINEDKKPICILCHNYCEKDNKKNKIIKLEKNKSIPKCKCKNHTHKSHKALCEKISDLISDNNEFYILLHPIKFINMLFKSQNSFKIIFEDFELFTEDLKISENPDVVEFFSKFNLKNILNTNIYKTLLIFRKIVQKNVKKNYLYFYNENILKYFSKDIMNKLFFMLEQSLSEEKAFSLTIIMNQYLYLFNKLYINFKIRSLSKYKLNDIKNISFFQKMIIFNKNKDIFTESEEITTFLLKVFSFIISKSSFHIESIECIKEIISILRKISCFNLINNEIMIKICITIVKSFNYIRLLKNSFNNNNNQSSFKNTSDFIKNTDFNHFQKVILKLFYVIMKMIFNFAYNYNDNILNKMIFETEKYHKLNNINYDNICFIYKRNDLGRFINAINIYILSYIQKQYNNYNNKKIKLIQRIGIEILEYSLNKEDNYILNIINSINQAKLYFINSPKSLIKKNQYYKELNRHCNLISNSFQQYFNFEKSIEDMINIVNDSLNIVLGEVNEKIQYIEEYDTQNKFNNSQIMAILSTNYFTLLSKTIGIINHYQNREKISNINKRNNNIKLNLFIQSLPLNVEDDIIKKILYFYFCFVLNSPDNSLLIFTQSIFVHLTKAPIKYCHFVFKLFYICIKNVSYDNNSTKKSVSIIIEKAYIIKGLYSYIEMLIQDKNINPNNLLTCIHYFLLIIEIVVFNFCFLLNNNNFIYKIQNTLIMIERKYNLINRFFDLKDSELFSHNKTIKNYSDKYNNEVNEDTIDSNKALNKINFEFFKRNYLTKSFVIYLKLINNCFDFSIEEDRKKIEEIINIDKVIFALQQYRINLDLRTEFLRLLRKYFLDIKYSDGDNNLYTKLIINTQDYLKDIKNNPLINNMEYPTKLLSFLNNFYNISAKCFLKEKIKAKTHLEKNVLNKIKTVDLENEKQNRQTLVPNISFNGKSENDLKINNSIIQIEEIEEKNNSSKKLDDDEDTSFEVQIEKTNDGSNLFSNKVYPKKDKLLNISNEIIIEENSNIVNSNIVYDKEKNKKFLKSKSINNSDNIEINNSNISPQNEVKSIKPNRRTSCFIHHQTNTFENKKLINNLIIPPNKRCSIKLNEENDIEIKDLEYLMKIINKNDNEKFYSKCKDLNILEEGFNEKFYWIINYELDNTKKNIENIKLSNPDKIEYVRNYIENGLLIPLIFYFKKIFTLIHFLNGEEMLKIFSLIVKTLQFKIYISEFNIDFWEKGKNSNYDNFLFEKNEYINSQNYYYTNYNNPSIIDGSGFKNNKSIDDMYDSLNFIISNKISMFDYTSLYQLIDKELFSLIKERQSLNIIEIFKMKNSKSLKKQAIQNEMKIFLKKNKPFKSDIHQKLLKAFIIYKYNKLSCFSENNSSLMNILHEITSGYEFNYRNLLLNLLTDYGKEINLKNEFTSTSYFLLLKLLSFQTSEVQNDLIQLLGGENCENPGFLKDFSNILFLRIILLFIDYLNPPDKLFHSNYLVSCNLIFILKLLCNGQKTFYQRFFIKSLSYNYVNNNLEFFSFKNKDESELSISINDIQIQNSSFVKIDNCHEYNINFYDFCLYLLTKIVLISNWEYNYQNSQYENKYLYDLFASILDLLTEIIQGCESDLLYYLCINLEEGVLNALEDMEDLEQYKKIDSFEFFIKNIKTILFNENYNSSFINKLKKNLMHFITSILEEKNCNEVMKKSIKKYLNINNIFKVISIIMKSYYLEKIKSKQNELNKIKNKKNFNKFKKTNILKRNYSLYNPFVRPKMKRANKKRKTKYSVDGNTSVNIRLVTNSSYIYKDVSKRFSVLDVNKNKNKQNIFKKLLTSDPLLKNKIIENEEINKENSKILEMKISNLLFGKQLYNYFKKQFRQSPEFIETLEFQLSNSFYRYIKIMKLQKKKTRKKLDLEKIKKFDDKLFLRNINNENDEKFNLKDDFDYEKYSIEKYYIDKFFEDITNTVEICTNEGTNKEVVFTKISSMKYLSKETKKEFELNLNRDNETSKKYDLVRYIEYFLKEIKYYKKYKDKWIFWLLKIDFYYIDILSYFLALIYNLLLLFTLKGDNKITGIEKLETRHKNRKIIKDFINDSVKEWNIIYYIGNIITLLLNGFFIILWILYKLPLYYRIDQIKYKESFKIYKNKKILLYDKIYILFKMSIFGRNYISMLIYEFFICIICLLFKDNIIAFAFLLLPIFFINRTLKILLISIKINYSQFLLTFFLAFFIIYIFSNMYFFFYNLDFKNKLDYYNDNYCRTLIFSFLNALDNGLRARGGVGDSAERISFLKNKNHYIGRLVLDDLFFLLIVIIMIDLIFCIILKSFDELRHRNQKYKSDKKDYCTICHCNRKLLETKRINFNEHVQILHNEWNYIEYMISLKIQNIYDLNSINQYVRSKMERKDISWLPTYKDIISAEENNNIDDNNLIVFAENFENYKIRNISY